MAATLMSMNYFPPSPAATDANSMVKKEQLLSTAFQMREQGRQEHYLMLIQVMSTTDNVGPYYDLLSRIATMIKPNYTELLEVIFKFDWYRFQDTTTLTKYSDFLVHLNIAHGNTYLVRTFQTLVSSFYPQVIPANANGNGSGPTLAPETQVEQIMVHVHAALQKILWAMPTSSAALWPVLSDSFPHRTLDLVFQRAYLKHTLQVMDYCPSLKERLLLLVVDRLIHIDVEIKFDERDESEDAVDDEELNDDSSLMFAIEMSRNARNRQQQRVSSRAAQHVMSEAEVLENQETATKLDCLMDLMLAFLTTRPQQDWDDYYQSLLKAFDVIVLPTHKSKFTQFLMFYFCRAKMEYADHFLQYLFEQMENEERAIQHRQAAASYLGSYVARANYLSPNHVRGVLERLIGWLHTYAERFPSATPDTVRHGLFYAVAQASIYVLTFQHERLFHVVDSGYLKTLNLNRIVYSSLNPLKVCVQSVVNEFIRVAWSHGVRFDNMRQHNKRVLPTKTASGAANVFDAYFPFDPYLLQISSRFISPLYTQWQRRASDDGYGTDGEMELEDQPTSYDQLDEDDATQRDSMMQMMDFGRGSLDSGSGFAMARSFGERRASFSSSFNNGRGSGAFFPGSNGSGNSSPNRFFGDDHDSNGGGSPGSYTGNNGSFWPSR